MPKPSAAAAAFDPLNPGVPTTDDCLPIKPPYSLASLVSPAPAPLPEPTLRKLHQLACLPYPSSVSAASLQALIGVVDGIRNDRVRALLEAGGAAGVGGGKAYEDIGWGRKEIVFDGERELELVADAAAAEAARPDTDARGRELLKDATKTVGGVYYTVKAAQS